MNLDWMDEFADPYLKTDAGKGVFLSGVALGMLAKSQAGGDRKKLDSTPLFKQIMFGKMQRRDIERHLSRVPELLKAYDIEYKILFQDLVGKAGELLLKGSGEMGIDGNFSFAVAFLNADDYFWQRIFKKEEKGE